MVKSQKDILHSLSWCYHIYLYFRYKAFRDKDGEYTLFYWHLVAIRLGFVIIFEHFVFGICRIIDILVPDVPESLSLKMRRERYLAKQALADTEALMQVILHD